MQKGTRITSQPFAADLGVGKPPEDLSVNLVDQLGLATKELNRRWYKANTGQVVTVVQCSRWPQRSPDVLTARAWLQALKLLLCSCRGLAPTSSSRIGFVLQF